MNRSAADIERIEALEAHAKEGKALVRALLVADATDDATELTDWAESGTPTDSLALRDAQMRAAGGESALVQVAVELREKNSRGVVADIYGLAKHLEECARACRRQAEEAS